MAKEEINDIEEELENDESEEKTSEDKIKIDFSLDPEERLKKEMECATVNGKAIGQYILNEFANNEKLKNAYKERKITIESIDKYVVECAKKYLNSQNGMIEDKVVFGWVIHYVQDEKVEITSNESTTIKLNKSEQEKIKAKVVAEYEAKEREKLAKAKAKEESKKQKAVEREKKHNEEIGQLSLFEL